VEVVLLDRGAGLAGEWNAAVDSVRSVLSAGDRLELLLFDTIAVRVPARELSGMFLDSLAAAGPGDANVDYAVALRGLAGVVRARTDADSFRVSLVTRPRWEGWSPGLGEFRAAIWPGGIRVVAPGVVGGGARGDAALGRGEGDEGPVGGERGAGGGRLSVDPGPGTVAEVLRGGSGAGGAGSEGGEGGEGDFAPSAAAEGVRGGWGEDIGEAVGYVEAALEALGWEVRGGDGVPALIVLPPVPAEAQTALLARARAGATVVVAGELPAVVLHAAMPWVGGEGIEGKGGGEGEGGVGALVLKSGTALTGAERRLPGHPRPGSRLLAAWEDGRPAAAGAVEGAGCLVYLATDLEAGWLPLSPSFPELLDRLLRGCADDQKGRRDDRPLDLGARAVLAGHDASRTIAAVEAAGVLGASAGQPLGRWFLLAALGLALVETLLAYRRGAA
jgi:hypothetical protein